MMAAKDSDPSLGFLTKKETEAKLPRSTRVKNKTPAPRQITSEQILREARREAEIRPPKRKIADSTELVEYRLRKQKELHKKYGEKERIEDAIVERRRFQYEEEVRKNPRNYDLWLDYIRLEESARNNERIREVYERAIANVPLAEEKRYWQRYIYLWINYALFEELEAEDVERTRDVYRECLKLIPHEKFSFAKIWVMAAQLEIRQLNLKGARLILGNAIGKASKDKIFKKYIELELQLGNIDRCRKLYEKYLEWSPENCYAWSKYAEMEKSLSETERARAIFELAIAQPALDMPELLWKAYIDFKISEGEFEKTREPYERLDDTGSDYLFPEETQNTNFKILEAAYRWKKQKTSR